MIEIEDLLEALEDQIGINNTERSFEEIRDMFEALDVNPDALRDYLSGRVPAYMRINYVGPEELVVRSALEFFMLGILCGRKSVFDFDPSDLTEGQ